MNDQVIDRTKILMDAIQLASVDQFRISIRSGEVEAKQQAESDLPYCQQLAHILVSGEDIEVNFKTHFMLEVVNQYAALRLGETPKNQKQAIDFMKEYCNVVAGKIKQILEGIDLILGQSLPFSMQGYNELFYHREFDNSTFHSWMIDGPKGGFNCSVSMRIVNLAILEKIEKVSYQPQFGQKSTGGEIELF